MSVIQDDCSDASLRDVINDDAAPERKRAVAREMLKRRHHGHREAWLARHGLPRRIAALAGLAALVFRKKRQTA